MTDKWEYTAVNGVDAKGLLEEMNELGDEGWEAFVVAVMSWGGFDPELHVIFLKRKKQ